MAPMITAGLTMKGKPNYRDKNNFSYVFNGKRAETKNWRCSKRSHTANTKDLYWKPMTNKLLKTKAKIAEKAVIEKYANVQGVQPSKENQIWGRFRGYKDKQIWEGLRGSKE